MRFIQLPPDCEGWSPEAAERFMAQAITSLRLEHQRDRCAALGILSIVAATFVAAGSLYAKTVAATLVKAANDIGMERQNAYEIVEICIGLALRGS